MSKKIKSAEKVNHYIDVFRCPLCKSPMKVVELKSLVCSGNHTFDFTKQGYVNLMTHPSQSHYSKDLFDARQKIIMESNLYNPLHKAITKTILEHTEASTMVVDLGCGEGSHLQKILEECGNSEMTGVGIDIAKEGIFMAAKKYEDPIWIVGDLAKSPLQDQSFHVILNILSPSNYQEFKRILVENGIVIKVVPRPNYLKELRENLFDDEEKKEYKNDQIVSLFKSHFHLLDEINLSYTKQLNQAELMNLVNMTPLAWSADKTRVGELISKGVDQITVDLDILVGMK